MKGFTLPVGVTNSLSSRMLVSCFPVLGWMDDMIFSDRRLAKIGIMKRLKTESGESRREGDQAICLSIAILLQDGKFGSDPFFVRDKVLEFQ